MTNPFRFGVITSIIAFSIVLDQTTKALAESTLRSAPPKSTLAIFSACSMQKIWERCWDLVLIGRIMFGSGH